MTIERKDLEFILSHFEPPALPRRISTALSRDAQYLGYSIDFMMQEFQEAKELDCKVNAYRYLGSSRQQHDKGNGHGNEDAGYIHDYPSNLGLTRDIVAEHIHQKAHGEAAPSLLHIDLDRKNFSSDRTYENAVKGTLARINEVFLIPPGASPATTYWSGGGSHILLPLEVDPEKYPVKNTFTREQTIPGRDLRFARLFTGSHDYRFSANHRLPANLFLWFAKDYLTNGKGDTGHHPSVRSSMVRAPGSYNSKYDDRTVGEVKIKQRWDGNTKAHILFLLGAFYRNVGDDHKKQARMLARARNVKRRMVQAAQIALDRTIDVMPVPGVIATQGFGEGAYSIYAHNKYWYIDKLLQTPIEDFRKRSIDLLLAPFLITIKGMSADTAERIMLNWLDRCSALKPLDFDAAERVQEKIAHVKESHYLPLGVEKFKAQDSDLFFRLEKGIRGG